MGMQKCPLTCSVHFGTFTLPYIDSHTLIFMQLDIVSIKSLFTLCLRACKLNKLVLCEVRFWDVANNHETIIKQTQKI